MTSDPKILAIALLGGIVPALLWLLFWLREDSKRPEPKGLLAIVFFLGMLSIAAVIPIQQWIRDTITSYDWQIVSWAAAEELIKYLAVLVLLLNNRNIDEPLDWPIYLMTAALGFTAIENALYLLKPLTIGQNTVGLLTGQIRFLGATLLHAVSSGILGISIGLAFFMNGFARKIHLIIGLMLATILHSIFNFFIIENNGGSTLKALGFLWVVTIIVMLLFEKLRRMSLK